MKVSSATAPDDTDLYESQLGVFLDPEDPRSLAAAFEGVEALRLDVLDWIGGSDLFRRLLTEQALRRRPPLGHFRDFRLTRGGDHPNTFDLKLEALTPLIDAVRVLALGHGVTAVSTTARLRRLAADGVLRQVDADAYEEACQHLQLLRLHFLCLEKLRRLLLVLQVVLQDLRQAL